MATTIHGPQVAPYKKWLWMLAAALGLALLCTFITWPGIFYSDSYGRWQMAVDLTHLNFATQDDWLSAPPQLFMAVVYKLFGGSYAAYTFLQAAAYFFTAFFAIDAFVPHGKWPAWVLFAACPVFYGFSVYIEMSVGCVTALLWLLWLLLCFDHAGIKKWKPGGLALYFFVCCFLYFVMLGFRQNAFTVLPVLFFAAAVLYWRMKTPRPLVLHAMAAVLALAVIAAVPKVLHFGWQRNGGSGSVGFLWETVSMLGELQDKPEYDGYLDDLAAPEGWMEPGTTQNAVEMNHYSSIYGYQEHIQNWIVAFGDNASLIRKKYLHLLINEPDVFMRVKGRFWARTLGITEPLIDGEYDYNRHDRMDEFGYRDTPARQAFHQSYHGFLQAFSVVRRPWAVFAVVLALLLLARKWLCANRRYHLWILYAAAVFYYGSFLITTQSQEFRYFFVPLVLLYIVGAASLGVLAQALWGRFRPAPNNNPKAPLKDRQNSASLQEENV